MKPPFVPLIATVALLPTLAFSQTPPNPPAPPAPPSSPGVPASPGDRADKVPKVPVTYLGVDTSPVPPVVCEQMNLAKGFGLVVDYVVPGGPAATAGIQQNDILKMFNDQILLEPSQLAKLVRSYSDGTTVTFTILRKGKEEKVTVKLGKKEMPQRRGFGPHRGDFPFGDHDFGALGDSLQHLQEQFGGNQSMMQDAVMKAHQEMDRAKAEARREADRAREEALREARRTRAEAQREALQARNEARRAAGELRITQNDDTGLKRTKIDIGKAQIVFSDDKGELRVEKMDGRKVLTAKDPKGLLLFSGPVETTEDLEKVPAEVRQRYENLQQRDLPSVVSPEESATDAEDDADADEEDEDENDAAAASTEQVCITPQAFPRNLMTFRMILI